MATENEIFAKQYSATIVMLSQQKGSRFRQFVQEEPVTSAEEAYFNTLAPSDEPQQNTTRHGDTPISESDWNIRKVAPVTWEDGKLLDEKDLIRLKVNPQGAVAQNQANSFGRKIDTIIRDAALGNAYIGKAGTTTISLEAESIGLNGTTGAVRSVLGTLPAAATPVGLELAKILEMALIFAEADVDPELARYWAIAPSDVTYMLGLTQVGSADYNTVKALTTGKVDTFMGFRFVPTNRLSKDAATETCWRTFAWVEGGLILAPIGGMTTRIDPRVDKKYSIQIYSTMDIGAVRMEGAKVHECLTVL